jgi:uncharacterized protein YyaL (SSP411 family)
MFPNIGWRDWSPGAFREAAEQQRPVLLSLVTAWSDECTVMDGTTYAHPDVVSVVDRRFVPVRVDADRRPDINDRYNLGGWPTTVFLTSGGDVLSGGTYFDADRMSATLHQVADAYRDRADELAARAAAVRGAAIAPGVRLQPDDFLQTGSAEAVDRFRSLLIERFDRAHGGFGSSPKVPHPYALLFALSLAGDGDAALAEVAGGTLDAMLALWDSSSGGFYRYADSADWSAPAAEKTLEDNAALLHVFVEAAIGLGDERGRTQAAAIVQWVKSDMSDEAGGGFFNASTPRLVDRAMYVDRNAMMVGALIRAAALFDDIWLRDLALRVLEEVIVPAYKPGDGVAHVAGGGPTAAVRGLLTDQIHVASALVWAHAATGRLPYSMLAAEVLHFAVRTMWDERAGRFRDRVDSHDPVWPFELNCHAACAFARLAALTGDAAHQVRAETLLRSLAGEHVEQDLFGAPYALAVREVIGRRRPAGLELNPVDWQLG